MMFFLQACLLQPTLTPKQVEETAISGKMCTLVGCTDGLLINLAGNLPAAYIVKIEDTSGKVGAIQCFKDEQTAPIYPGIITGRYHLNDPEAEKIRQVSPILSFCNSNSGYFSVNTLENSSIDSIAVQCFEEKSNDFSAICWDKAVSFYSFSPSELTVSVYWSDKIKSKTVKPVYESWYPNGQGCEPTCQSSTINIEIP
jgi:hypothetical protein